MYPYIEIFNYKLPTYWIFGIAGIIACLIFVKVRGKKYDISKCDITNIWAMSLVGAVIGSKILYLITVLPEIIKNADKIEHPLKLIEFLFTTGFVFYGGLIGALAAVYIYCRRYKLENAEVFSLMTPAIPLFHFFGRIGCFFAGCCYGVHGFPIQLVESGFNLILFAVLVIISGRSSKSRNFERDRMILPIYLIVYAAGRFIIEFFRGDEIRGYVSIFSTSQWISIIIVISVSVWIIIKSKNRSKKCL